MIHNKAAVKTEGENMLNANGREEEGGAGAR